MTAKIERRKHLARFWLAGLAWLPVVCAFAATRYDGDGALSPRRELQRWYINT